MEQTQTSTQSLGPRLNFPSRWIPSTISVVVDFTYKGYSYSYADFHLVTKSKTLSLAFI